ncbi:hypothetical protein [Streptomyces sp. H39-C1]|uniref:hypothetical protein n=1 Tax=Streptomyces sp. H39-C1 TaxID=3004355 RepID=UPI0022B01953|nr:hypothetical protein [Streptomyces sp. H39-C1]MCZ4103043.1 hypothetical protein [Streptomyces sp. H39-C1]
MKLTAFSPDSLLALRFQNARPGLDLIAVVDAAIPVSLVTADVLAQDRKPLPLLDEFVLRFVDADVTSREDLTGILGLPTEMVTGVVADQFSADNLAYARPGQQGSKLQLTARGKRIAQDLASIAPVNVELPLVFDRLLWKTEPYDRNVVISRRDAEESDMLLLPTKGTESISAVDVTPGDINALLRSQGNVEREVLVVRRATANKARRFMPAKVLVFADAGRSDIQLAVVVDEELSSRHEHMLLNLGGAEALGIRVDPPEQRPQIDPELEKVRVPLDEVTRLRAETAAARIEPSLVPATDPALSKQAAPEGNYEVRAIGVFEHPDLLEEALTSATRRILLISPWVKNGIVTTDFLMKLEDRLRRNVAVHIAHGIGTDDNGSHAGALRKLENLAQRYPEKFTFSRLRSTHAKILIFDDTWINTSFNWLSFSGSRDRTYRMEEGTLVRGTNIADEHYQRYLSRIQQDSV